MMQLSKVDFFVGEILNKEFVLDNTLRIPTMATDGVKIYYTDAWVDKCTDDELIFCIVHEFMHIIFMHSHYTKTMNLHPEAANIAMDTVINAILQQDGIGTPIKGGITANYNGDVELNINGNLISVKEAHKKNFLEVYKMISLPPPDNRNGKGEGEGGYGKNKVQQDGKNVKANDDIIPQSLTEEQQSDVRADVNSIEAKSKMKGIGSSFARCMVELTKGVVPWKNYIRPVVDRATAGFPTYSRPNRRETSSNIIIPSIKRMGVQVTVAIDTSGTIKQKELGYFLGEIDNLMNSYPKGSVSVNTLYHTDKVYSIQKNCKYMKDIITQTRSGGTCHHDVFKQSEDLNSKILICLTDGYSSYPLSTTIGNVIFICIAKGGSVPTFAKRVDVDTTTWGIKND